MTDASRIKRALISVSDKTGLEALVKELHKQKIEILSTGGTKNKIKEAGVPVISVSAFTGSPEILDGRVKTLHPKIHAGILYRRGNEEHISEMQEQEYRGIDLVVANLYPFEETVRKPEVPEEEIIENIDVGGPSMIRAAAKNFESVTVITDPSDYEAFIEQLKSGKGKTTLEFRRQCAAKAFALSARYEAAIAGYFQHGKDESGEMFPHQLSLAFTTKGQLRYGENPHQQASAYRLDDYKGSTMLDAEIHAGKELSYNNYNDLDACLDLILEFTEPFACLIKHTNPCGAAIGSTLAEAYKRAYESDPLSAYGSIIGLNREVDIETAKELHETPFVECIVAPSYNADALALLQKKKNRRLLSLPSILNKKTDAPMHYRYLRGGLLAQTADDITTLESSLKPISKRQPTKTEIVDMLFAWKIVKHTKSNAIVLAKSGATVGIGMGQTSRVDSAFMAVKRAGDRAKGAVCASDAFFPMPDGIETCTSAGVTAFIQPGGSQGDEQAIAAVDSVNAAMVFTGIRHFKH